GGLTRGAEDACGGGEEDVELEIWQSAEEGESACDLGSEDGRDAFGGEILEGGVVEDAGGVDDAGDGGSVACEVLEGVGQGGEIGDVGAEDVDVDAVVAEGA